MRRAWVLPLGPLLLLWAAATLFVQAREGLRVEAARGRLTASGPQAPAEPAARSDPRTERRLRAAYALLARGEAARARPLLLEVRARLGDHPLVLRALGRCEKALGHRVQAAAAYDRLLGVRPDDVEALRFRLAARWEDDDLPGALAVAARLARLGALDGEASLLARRIQAEWVSRRVMGRPRRD